MSANPGSVESAGFRRLIVDLRGLDFNLDLIPFVGFKQSAAMQETRGHGAPS